ncbi:MAG: single-stranded DNA-binding protein [Bacteroidota bacterium]
MNRVTLIGNLGRDPELKYLDQGIAVTNLWMACTESYRDKNGNNVDRTEWISVNLWRSQAEIAAKYCRRGSTVCIEGRITSRSWETPQGEKRRVTEVEGRRIILLDSRPADPSQQPTGVPVAQPPTAQPPVTPATPNPQPEEKPQTPEAQPQEDLDDLPF